jgi:hypothetical protein
MPEIVERVAGEVELTCLLSRPKERGEGATVEVLASQIAAGLIGEDQRSPR